MTNNLAFSIYCKSI